jgi:hypothetical protein
MSMSADALPAFAELGVDRLLPNLGSQRPEKVNERMAELEKLVKRLG